MPGASLWAGDKGWMACVRRCIARSIRAIISAIECGVSITSSLLVTSSRACENVLSTSRKHNARSIRGKREDYRAALSERREASLAKHPDEGGA